MVAINPSGCGYVVHASLDEDSLDGYEDSLDGYEDHFKFEISEDIDMGLNPMDSPEEKFEEVPPG